MTQMKKLLQFALAAIILFTGFSAEGQPSKKALAQKDSNHMARFNVFDFTTKRPISQALILDEMGNELGQTDGKGVAEIYVPINTKDFYTVKAEGFNPMNIRLDQSDRKTGKYEVFLPSAEIGYNHVAEASPDEEGNKDLVKVYIKQDPATYQKKGSQGSEIMFSVQVAASSHPISESSAKDQWQDLGQVYVHRENDMYKIRIGPFNTQQEAKQVLLAAKSKGRKDAFIVVQQGLEYALPSVIPQKPKDDEPSIPTMEKPASLQTGDFKVRVASYLHPGSFNPEGIDKLGRLESYRKGEWTIMMIGGFENIEEARRAKNVVTSKGFTDAAIVVDRDGIIETIEEN